MIAPPSEEGRLRPRYMNSIGIFVLESTAPRPSPFGIAVDAMLMLDFDPARVLAGVELVLPMSGWKGKADLARPRGEPGDVLLADPAFGDRDWRVTVSKDAQAGAARIDLAPGGFDRAVRLSEASFALLLGDALTGFWFSLDR